MEWLANTLSKNEFESNSQQNTHPSLSGIGWLIPCQRTNLKAIHNLQVDFLQGVLLANTLSKNEFESNSQQWSYSPVGQIGWLIPCQRTNLKAIHNFSRSANAILLLANTLSKNEFESNSQHRTERPGNLHRWLIPCQRTNLKAIHNIC